MLRVFLASTLANLPRDVEEEMLSTERTALIRRPNLKSSESNDAAIHDSYDPAGNTFESSLYPTSSDDNAPKSSPTKVPVLQLLIILLVQLCEPLTAMVVYTFVNQFVRDTGITHGDEKATGYYAGIIESLFFWTEGLAAIPSQLASDHFGRRPMMLIAPLGLGISMLGFGWTKSFWGMVVFRALQGVFNGDVGVSKTILAEITDNTNRAQTLALIPAMWSIASCVAPFIGGFFSSPVSRWPEILGNLVWLRERPYFLPCAISAVVCFFAFGVALVGLEETAPAVLHRRRKLKNVSDDQDVHEQGGSVPRSSFSVHRPTVKDILTRPVIFTLGLSGLFAMMNMFSLALQPLVWSTSIENGGLGFSAYTIGLVNSLFGIPNAIFQLSILGRLLRRFSARTVTISGFWSCFFYVILFPFQTYYAQPNGIGGVGWSTWVFIVLQLLCSSVASGASASIVVHLIDASPTTTSISTIQGVAQTVAVAARGLAPWIATSLFAFSKQHNNILDGNLVYLVLGVFVLGAVRVSLMVERPTV